MLDNDKTIMESDKYKAAMEIINETWGGSLTSAQKAMASAAYKMGHKNGEVSMHTKIREAF